MNNTVYALVAYKDDLIAAGTFTTAGGTSVNRIARWDGAAWHALESGITGGTVYALTVYNEELIVGGNFSMAGGVSARGIAAWTGAVWRPLASGVGSTSNVSVFALAEFAGDLIVGGSFTTAGEHMSYYWARWGPNPEVITAQPRSRFVAVGGTAQLSIETTVASPAFRWRRNGVNLADGGPVSGAATANLTISPFDASHAGEYTCLVTDDCGSLSSNAATLGVLGEAPNPSPPVAAEPQPEAGNE